MAASPDMPHADEPFLTIAGPTAVGKTALSLTVAEELGAEIISADSRQVYRDLTIGTAKPTPEELQQVPHHFIGELSLHEDFSAGRFADAANERIRDVLRRGRTPLIVGGSTLYLKALHFGLADIPDVDPTVREEMEVRLQEEGGRALYAELKRVDPAAAETMDPTKTQRLLRALEVYHGTGKPITHFYDNQPEPPFTYRTVVLNRDRSVLHRRIEERVEGMLERGLLQEVESLLEKGYDATCRPLKSIGYREPIRFLKSEIDYDEMVRLIKRNTRRYAKRQITWFRRFDTYRWLSPPFTPQRLWKAE